MNNIDNTLKTPNKASGTSKVLDAIKTMRSTKVEVGVDNLHSFIMEKWSNVSKYMISYTDWNWETVVNEKRFFANSQWVGYLPKWRKSKWYVFQPYRFKDLSIVAVMKKDSSIEDKEEYFRKKDFKLISKFRNLEFHKNLVGNYFQEKCSKLPKTYEEFINDKPWKDSLNKDWVKSLYDYGVTAWCGLDGKVIWEKRLISLFWESSMQKVKQALDNKEKYHDFTEKGYDYTISVEGGEDGWPMRLYLSEEFRWCGNGHYYAWSNWNNFIYVEKD